MPTLVLGSWRSLALRGVVAVLFGLLALIWPGITLGALVLLFGAYALVDGISLMVAAFTGEPEARRERWMLILEGIVGVWAGLAAFFWPGISALALVYVIAAWALVTGVLEIVAAIRLRREIDNEWLLGLSGVVSIIFAFALVLFPVSGAFVVTWVIGVYAILFGALLLALALRIRSQPVEVHRPAEAR